jgi:hypothetical protein
MKRLLALPPRSAWLVFAFLDTFCVGMGMGVPIFCIAFGSVVGYYLAHRFLPKQHAMDQLLRGWLRYAALTSLFTLVLMALLWGPWSRELWNPQADYANFGIPLILYDPRASFAGWLVLMILVSPFLQLLTTLFGAHVTYLWLLRGGELGPGNTLPSAHQN